MEMGLFFSYPMSLEGIKKRGLLSREKRIFEEHIRRGDFDKITWFTYGYGDEKVRDELVKNGILDPGIEVVGLPHWAKSRYMRIIYILLFPILQKERCKQLDVVRTTQTAGGILALRVAKAYSAVFEYRTGYTLSIFNKNKARGLGRENAQYFLKYIISCISERQLYKKCDIAVVSSEHDRQYCVKKYGVDERKISVLPNYIDCDEFCSRRDFELREERFVFVGRFDKQKNLVNLIKAFGQVKVGLDLYGFGPQEEELKALIRELNVDVVIKGRVDNHDLPEIYSRYKYFILPSFYEGMPKTLLEAMACGCICFATNVEGNSEVIKHEDNGLLVEGTEAENVCETINQYILSENNVENTALLESISRKGISFIEEFYSLKKIAQIEKTLLGI